MDKSAETLARARMRLSRAVQPARNIRYVAWRWLRRQMSRPRGVEERSLTEAGVAGVEIVARLNARQPPIELPLPRDIAGATHRFFEERRSIPVFERYLARINDARIHAPDGFLYLPDGRVLLEHHFFFRAHVENHDLYLVAKPEPHRIEGPVFPLIGFCPAAHYHWMTEVLYRLHGVIDLLPPETRFVIPAAASQTHREALRAFGIGPDRFLEMKRDDHFQFSDLWYAPPVTRSGYDVPAVAQWLRGKFAALGALDSPANGGVARPERILISRRSAHRRRIVNEDEIMERLAPLGFVCVECEKLGFAEQAATFSRAREVIAPHGAGLVNLLFAPAGGRILEIFPEEIPEGGTCYWSLASALGWNYTFTRGAISGRGADASDLAVDAAGIRAWAERAPSPSGTV